MELKMIPDNFSSTIAENVRSLREAQNLTQAGLAKRANTPRATLTLLESGSANPTLSVLVSVCNALGVRFEEILEAPPSETLVYRKQDLPTKNRRDVTIRKLLPQSIAGVDMEELLIPAGSTLVGVPHQMGTREYLTVHQGVIELRIAGELHVIKSGDVVVFRGHQKHSYRNPGKKAAQAFSVIALSQAAAHANGSRP